MAGGGRMRKIPPMRSLDDLFDALGRSRFRRRQRLGEREIALLRALGVEVVLHHARELLAERLFVPRPRDDGRQTPMRGHPAFVAQHATASCCRRCLARWHRIPAGRALTAEEEEHVLAALRRWLERAGADAAPVADAQLDLLHREE
jgi:hypothetical protein